MMDHDQILHVAAMALLCEEAEKEEEEQLEQIRKKRRFWVHDINLARNLTGEFASLFEFLLKDEKKFKIYFRMGIDKFQKLYEITQSHLQKKITKFRTPISPVQRLMVCLRFLATGDRFNTIAFSFKLGHSTVAKIVNETCLILWEILQPLVMPEPTAELWEKIERGFDRRWEFPNCLGCIDGKHVMIQAPNKSGSLFYNYKNFFSIVLLALVDYNYKFIVVDAGSYGSNSDGAIFRNSKLCSRLENKLMNIPADKCLPGTATPMPHVIIGDEAFPLKPYLMRPYARAQLGNNEEKKIFNYRLSRARNGVENAFGIMSQKFQMYFRRLQQTPEHVTHSVLATCVLHNFLRDDIISFQDEENPEQDCVLQPLQAVGGNASTYAMHVRDKFKDFFNSNGSVQWQSEIVNRGRVPDN